MLRAKMSPAKSRYTKDLNKIDEYSLINKVNDS